MADYGPYHSPTSPPPPLPNSANLNNTMRPTSTMTTMTSRSDGNRASRYAPSLASNEARSTYSHHHFPHAHLHRHPSADEFYFPRPDSDAEIEALFDDMKRTRDLGQLPHLTIDQKWNMVESHERIRWKDEKTRDEQSRRQQDAGRPAAIEEGSPQWYVKKFLDKTITAKQASGLWVSLRGKEMRYVLSPLWHIGD